MNEHARAYVGRCKHGKIVYLLADDGTDPAMVAKEHREAVKRGLTLTLASVEEARNSAFGRCKVCIAERKKPGETPREYILRLGEEAVEDR